MTNRESKFAVLLAGVTVLCATGPAAATAVGEATLWPVVVAERLVSRSAAEALEDARKALAPSGIDPGLGRLDGLLDSANEPALRTNAASAMVEVLSSEPVLVLAARRYRVRPGAGPGIERAKPSKPTRPRDRELPMQTKRSVAAPAREVGRVIARRVGGSAIVNFLASLFFSIAALPCDLLSELHDSLIDEQS